MDRIAVSKGNGRTAPLKVVCGLVVCFAVLWATGTWALAASAAGFWALATAFLRRAAPIPWWYHMLMAAPGAVIASLVTHRLQAPASGFHFAAIQSAVSEGMVVGFVTGIGLSLILQGIRGWKPGSTVAAVGLLMPIFLLATLATHRMCGCTTKERAYVATMKSDLRNLALEQEAYFADHGAYAADIGTKYDFSHGVDVQLVTAVPTGWYAVASHELTPITCSIYVGEGVPTTRAVPGELLCE